MLKIECSRCHIEFPAPHMRPQTVSGSNLYETFSYKFCIPCNNLFISLMDRFISPIEQYPQTES